MKNIYYKNGKNFLYALIISALVLPMAGCKLAWLTVFLIPASEPPKKTAPQLPPQLPPQVKPVPEQPEYAHKPACKDKIYCRYEHDLSKVQIKGKLLQMVRGSGLHWQKEQRLRFDEISKNARSSSAYPIQYNLVNLDSGQSIAASKNLHKKFFGASVTKLFVAATLLDQQQGKLSQEQLQLMADMIVVSSNKAWIELQNQIGHGDKAKGQQTVWNFSKRMGYIRSRPFQGWLDDIHGNELNVVDASKLLYDTYQKNYAGADILWKLMSYSRTGASRGKKYISTTQQVGGKTGTYTGESVDPETGDRKSVV